MNVVIIIIISYMENIKHLLKNCKYFLIDFIKKELSY